MKFILPVFKRIYLYVILLILVTIAVFVIYQILMNKNHSQAVSTKDYYPLPSILHEVSGVVYLGNNQIAMVQDEDGLIFVFDMEKERIVKSLDFGEPGDYEGIAFTGTTFYILRSDGVLFEFKEGDQSSLTYELNTGASNNEGLTYDSQNDRLLVSTKSKVGDSKENRDKRYIYVFDLKSKTLVPEPRYVIDINDIDSFIATQPRLEIRSKDEESKNPIKFRPSGLTVNQKTNILYVLSAIDNLIVAVNSEGDIVKVKQLDIEIFNKPEGITFFNEYMLIVNEGENRVPTLHRVNSN